MRRALSPALRAARDGLPQRFARPFSSAAPPPPPPDTTHFGAATIPAADKQRRVGEVFHRVAESYDVMNDLMSAGVHRLWKDEFVRMAGSIVTPGAWAGPKAGRGGTPTPCVWGPPAAPLMAHRPSRSLHPRSPPPPPPLTHTGDRETVVLDVAGGTGDIAFRIREAMQRSFVRPRAPPRIIVTDINASMLQVGRERAAARGLGGGDGSGGGGDGGPTLEWREGNAERLDWQPDASVDLYTIAFGIRNVTRVDAALREAHRVLRPGGRFMCLEFSRVTLPPLAALYDAYSYAVIPALGGAVANDRASYQYLVESIRRFPDQGTFADMISDAGFSGVQWRDFSFGVCAVHSGVKL